jgi:hypothetical protein
MTDQDLPALIETPPGRYRHYKGGLYDVVATVRHSESLEPMTLYRALYGEHGLWVRPAAMFNEQVVVDGLRQRRFVLIGAQNAPESEPLLHGLARSQAG